MEINESRRNFFRQAPQSLAQVLVDEADRKLNNYRRFYVRPPYAIAELEFLLKCTRCNACIEACSYATIFALSDRMGLGILQTPALDLINNACRLCADFPCVKACNVGALLKESDPNSALPLKRLAYLEIDPQQCLPYSGPECGACGGLCPGSNAMLFDDTGRPRIDQDLCSGCGLCRLHCVVNPKAIRVNTLENKAA